MFLFQDRILPLCDGIGSFGERRGREVDEIDVGNGDKRGGWAECADVDRVHQVSRQKTS